MRPKRVRQRSWSPELILAIKELRGNVSFMGQGEDMGPFEEARL